MKQSPLKKIQKYRDLYPPYSYLHIHSAAPITRSFLNPISIHKHYPLSSNIFIIKSEICLDGDKYVFYDKNIFLYKIDQITKKRLQKFDST